MLTPKHLIKKKNDYRLIAISDIHGHLDRFKELLRKVNYDPVEDYLVIIGDFVEKRRPGIRNNTLYYESFTLS